LIEPCQERKKQELTLQILRNKNYPTWLEEKLGILEKTENLDSVLSDMRDNPVRIDDLVAMLKIAAFFVSNGYQDLEFIPPSQRETKPDIKISKDQEEIYIEVKLLQDTSGWGHIQDSLRAIPSGLYVEVMVDFELYEKQTAYIVAEAQKALLASTNKVPAKIDLGYATISFSRLKGIPATSTLVAVSTLDVWSVVGDEDYRGEKDKIRYSDIRRIFAGRLEHAMEQLSSVQGYRVVAFDIGRFMGDSDLLEDVFLGTPKVKFLPGRGAQSFPASDGLFLDEAYFSLDAAITFIGDAPHEAIANPKMEKSPHCLSLLGFAR
jgi:hypothetical protein